MIEKSEILEIARDQKVPISTIEKDYVLSWFLAAIQNHKELFDNWIFKGGTCLRKCYLENYIYRHRVFARIGKIKNKNKIKIIFYFY